MTSRSPTIPAAGRPAVPSTRSWSTGFAAGSQADLFRWPRSWKPDAPASPSPTWKPNHDPDPEGTAMGLTIKDTSMTSDHTGHTARQAPGHHHGWEVSWLPGQILDRNSAITAMVLADTAAQGDLHEGHRLWPHIQGLAEELGLTGTDAVARVSQPPPRPRSPGEASRWTARSSGRTKRRTPRP